MLTVTVHDCDVIDPEILLTAVIGYFVENGYDALEKAFDNFH